ncbi:MAG: hypothetical protein HY706_07680 [Candidatus Hydrogenedentes bacterium]|nr:hypothetical protein [Candidatus Hydrogenedentota bacterium]
MSRFNPPPRRSLTRNRPPVFLDNKTFTEDPNTILTAREHIAALIESLAETQTGGE